MRLVLDSLVALMLAGVLAGVVLYQRASSNDAEHEQTVRESVETLQREIHLQATLGKVEQSPRGYPMTIDPEWFAEGLPSHPLIEPGHPWLEVAPTDQPDHVHPDVCIAHDPSVAKFWYNPGTGVIRARVPAGLSNEAALAMYNRINQSELESLYRDQ